MNHLAVKVGCYSGWRAEQEPRWLCLDNRKIEVRRILDRWLGPGHRYFKILGNDGCIYILRHDEYAWKWELIYLSAF